MFAPDSGSDGRRNTVSRAETESSTAPRSPLLVLLLPCAFSVLLAALAALPPVRESARQSGSFLLAAGALCFWDLCLWLSAKGRGRALTARIVIRRPHWLQPIVQGSIYLYWGLHWPQVYQSVPLIAAQLVFAYAFDMLLAWSLNDEYELGFGPFPIILSVNLFMWFKPDWFYWQFAMIALGFGAKRLLLWNKDGRRVHIFNPSSLALAVVSFALILTGTTDHTWGKEIALTIAEPNHIFEFLFFIALPGQFLFGVATMSMPAVLTTVALGELYFHLTGTYYFFAQIPTAAFLGMLLLFTDPSTAPRSELGRILYGILYGLSVFVLYGLLDLLGLPLFYDKLLFVPFLNLGVQAIDRLAARPVFARLASHPWAIKLSARQRNLAFIGVWSAAFVGMLSFHAVGDVHPGNRLPFWMKACSENRRNGCRNLATMENSLCDRGSAWACNEYGIALSPPPSSVQPILSPDLAAAQTLFARACQQGLELACRNSRLLRDHADASTLLHGMPAPEEYQHLIDNKGLPNQRTGLQELQWACDQGWGSACRLLDALARGEPRAQLERACRAGDASSCRSLGVMYERGDGVPRDARRALACALGAAAGCVVPTP